MSDALELLTIGRICTDLYAEQLGVSLAEVRSFRKSVGGTATNVAVAAARLGHRTAVFTKVGDDPFGHYVVGALRDTFGVDTRFVGMHPSLRTPLAFAELQDPGEPSIIFYREPMAPEMTITPDEVDPAVVREVPILWVPAGALAGEPSRATITSLLAERGRRTHTIIDLDWRPVLWGGDAARAREAINEVLPFATMAIDASELTAAALGPSTDRTRLLADTHAARQRLGYRWRPLAHAAGGTDAQV